MAVRGIPNDLSIRGEHSLGERCSIMRAECARGSDLVPDASEHDLPVPKCNLLPETNLTSWTVSKSYESAHISPSRRSTSSRTGSVFIDMAATRYKTKSRNSHDHLFARHQIVQAAGWWLQLAVGRNTALRMRKFNVVVLGGVL
jgi:hypothetical protein